MVSKRKISKVKLSYHVSSRMKASNASRMNHKTNFSQSMVHAKTLPRVHVSITRLMPTKMPDIAKEQYYKLVKSSGLLRVFPAENTTWEELSPEATPERELEKKSHNSDLLSPITRTQLQLSPVDLEDADLGYKPWSDSSDPYPSPKSPENNAWFERSFEDQEEVDELLCGNPVSPCDNEVEAIMARQNCEVPKDVQEIPVHRPHPRCDLLQTIIIPLQPVDKIPCLLDVSRNDSPVFDRVGIWTSPGRKWSIAKPKEMEKRDLKRKRGRPKKKRKAPKLTTSVHSSNSTDNITSPSPLANGIQVLEQEDAGEGLTNTEEEASPKIDTELLNENRSVAKVSSKKRGRPRKRKSALICEPKAEQHGIRVEEETSQSRNKKFEVRVSPVIFERTIDSDNSTSQEGTQVSIDVREEKRSENREAYMNLQIEAHPVQGSGTPNEQTPVLSALEGLSQGNDLDSMEEVASFDEIPAEDNEQVRETPVTTPSKWLSAVQIESSPLIKSLEIRTKQNGTKSPTMATIFLTDEQEKRQLLNSESNNNNESIQQERLRSLRQELFPQKELRTGSNVSKCKSRNRKSSEESSSSPIMSLRPLEARLSTSSNEDVPVLNKEDKSKECLENFGRKTSPVRRLSVVCEGLSDAVVLDKNNTCDSLVLERSAPTENITPENEMTERQEVSNRSLSFEPGCQASKKSPLISNRGVPVLILNGKDTNSDQRQNELLEGKVHLIPCSPIQISSSPVFDARRRKCSSSSIESSRSDTACKSTVSFTEESNTLRTKDDKKLSKKSSGRRKKSSLDNPLSRNLSSKKSNASSLDGIVPLTPYSSVQSVQTSTIWKQRTGKEGKNSSTRTSPTLGKSSETVSPPNAFKSPVPLKDLVVKCDRIAAGDYNVLKSPENLLSKPPKRRRTRQKVETENKDTSKEQKRNTGNKRKRGNKSEKDIKPRKKRKLGIPDHYKAYKPCQLPTISHTQMRYRVAFNLWPQKYSGALDRINQRLMNQNAFWKSLG